MISHGYCKISRIDVNYSNMVYIHFLYAMLIQEVRFPRLLRYRLSLFVQLFLVNYLLLDGVNKLLTEVNNHNYFIGILPPEIYLAGEYQ